jgi:nucleoside-diphosphate-sugar epimerase
MRILIAGGAGYIGSYLIPVLIERGYEIEVVDLMWFGNHLPDEVKVTKRDLFECKEKDLEIYDQIIFLAGLSNDPMAEFEPAMNFVFNAALPSYLAFTAKKAGVKRFIYASSCSVYGYTVNELYDEDSPATCGYPYGVSKLQGERGVLQLQDDDFSVIALRKGTVSGFSPRMRLDLIVNTMFKFAISDKHITVNNPSIWRPVLDIEPKNEKAAKNIEVARLIIKDIIDQINKQKQQDPNQPQASNQSQQQQQAQEASGQDPNQSQEQKAEKQQEEKAAPDATAQEILDKEQRQKQQRQILERARYQKVDKDW